MKRYNEYTREELVELTPEQQQTLIDLEVAYAGIMPVFEPEMPKIENVELHKSMKMFEAHNLLFKDEKDALTLAGMKVFNEHYDYYGAGYSYKYPELSEKSSVNVVMLYDKADVMKYKSILLSNKELQEAYEKQYKEYEKYDKAISGIRTEVRSAIDAAWTWKMELDQAKKMQEKFLRLSEGDTKIAERFFRDAYKSREDIIEAIYPKEPVL